MGLGLGLLSLGGATGGCLVLWAWAWAAASQGGAEPSVSSCLARASLAWLGLAGLAWLLGFLACLALLGFIWLGLAYHLA